MKKILFIIIVSHTLMSNAVDWPGTGDCSGTLQSCIDAQPSTSSIAVSVNSLIAENSLTINKNLKLQAKTGFHPIFNNTHILVQPGPNKTITIKGFIFQGASYINGSALSGSEINILSNTWQQPDSSNNKQEGISIHLAPTLATDISTITIKGNTVIGEGSNNSEGFIDVASYAAGLAKVNIIDNHVIINSQSLTPADFLPAVFVHKVQQGKMDIQIVGNTIRGGSEQINFSNGGFATSGRVNIGILSNLMTGVIDGNSSSPLNSDHSALKFSATAGTISAIIGNNTLDGIKRETGVDGTGFNFSNLTSTDSVALSLFNNIVVNTAKGYQGPASGSVSSLNSSGNNIFWQHGSITGLTLLTSDFNGDPQFIQEGINYALKSNSPAIDIADTTGTALLEFGTVWLADAPQIDADGLRRFKGVRTDIGAYEWGDRHIFVQANNPLTNRVQINDSQMDANVDAQPIVTQVWNYQGSAGVYNDQAIGVYRQGVWRIFNQDLGANIPDNAKFHVFYPYGTATDDFNNLTHYSNSNTPDSGYELDDFFLNDNPLAAIFTTQYWTSIYNNVSLEVAYKTNQKWYLGNVDGSDMPTAAQAFVYAQDGSRNAYLHIVTPNNTTGNTTTLDHPLLNNNPCALPTIMQSTSYIFGPLFEQNPANTGVFYSDLFGRWNIFNQDISAIDVTIGGSTTVSGAFYVLVDPQQVYQCNDVIFKDGFE